MNLHSLISVSFPLLQHRCLAFFAIGSVLSINFATQTQTQDDRYENLHLQAYCFSIHISRIIRWSHSRNIHSRSCRSIDVGSLYILWNLQEEERGGQIIAICYWRSFASRCRRYFSLFPFFISLTSMLEMVLQDILHGYCPWNSFYFLAKVEVQFQETGKPYSHLLPSGNLKITWFLINLLLT